jgi:hypothetical protein
LRLPAQAFHLTAYFTIFIAIHFFSEYLYVTPFVGTNHLPIDMPDDTIAALFTAATVRETCYETLSQIIEETDYSTYTEMESLKTADENLLVLLSRSMNIETSDAEMTNAAILYDKAIQQLTKLLQ